MVCRFSQMSSISLSLAFVSKTTCILSPFRSTNVARLKWNICHFPTLWYAPPKPWEGKEQRKEQFLGYKDRFLKCVGGHTGKQNGKYLRLETETRCRTESVAWLVLLQGFLQRQRKVTKLCLTSFGGAVGVWAPLPSHQRLSWKTQRGLSLAHLKEKAR